MKPHEGELEREISKVQKTVCELRAGFSRALLELNQIQQGDTELQSQLEDTRHGCNKRALHLESLVLSLKEELEEVRCQFHQLCETRDRKPPDDPSGESNQAKEEGRSEGAAQTPPLSGVGGAFLIHCYMQGLQVSHWARLNTAADELSCPSTNSCLRRGRRRGVVEALLHSERDYVSTLNQLCEKYSTQPPVAFGKHLDQMLQGHLMFRNSLEERLSSDDRSSAAGKAFLNLTRQNNSFTDAYVGYVSNLPALLTTEFQTLQDGSGNTQEKERLRLLSLLFSPVSRIHTYLNIIQALTRSCGAGHVDWCALQDSEQVVRDLCRTCHMTLEKAGTSPKEEGPELGLRSRCWTESPDCGPSAFTKYCANSSEDAASVPAGTGMSSTSRQRKGCRAGISGTLPRANGILRNGQQRVREEPPGGWSAQYMWNGNMRQDYLGPICAPFPRDPSRILNTGPPNAEMNFGTGCKSLAMRVCGSPRLERHVYSSEPFPPHHPDEADTDCDRADGSIFDFSSVTTCSPDNTMSQLRNDDDDDDDDDDGEDSKVPVLLKPSYSHNTPAVQAGGSLCMQWQIPRRAPIPSELRVGVQSKVCSSKPHRIPASAFRPIWDPSYSQADVTPAKDTTVSFSSTNQIINQQQECDQSRSPYRSGGVQRAEAVWRDSEDSDGPCSTV